jgi:hypothetical protein
VNQRIEVRELEKRYRSEGEVRIMTEIRVTMNMRIKVWARIRAKVGIEVEWVPSIYLVEITK